MVGADQPGGSVNADVVSAGETDRDDLARQVQQVYEYILDDQRPEAVAATERLAQQLDIDLDRPSRFPQQTRR